ncbi:hypothetical protein HGA91_00535 [candidate division WWE3 bacterium]|nr:hypothetical protein [candidate division WWE3 bacterium]
MSTHAINQQIRDRIFRLSGKEFQQLVWDILIKIYPDLQTPKMNHDLGNDGYSISEKAFFAVYAPELAKYDNETTRKKISNPTPNQSEEVGDYEKFIANWKDKFGFTKWAFITKENLMGNPHQKIAELNQNGDGVVKEHWGVEQLIEKVMGLEESVIRGLFDLEADITVNQLNLGIVNNGKTHVEKQAQMYNEYNNYGTSEEDENTAVDEIFDYVISQLPQTPTITPADDRQMQVKAKIKLNFSVEKEQLEVEKYFTSAYTKTKLIENKLQALDPTIQGDIQLHILQKYNEFKRNSQTSIEILDKLFSFFTPKKRERNPTFAAVIRAFVLLYFEDCSIFEKE